MVEICEEASMSDYVPPLSTPHIIKYYLRALLGSVERTCGYIAFDVSIVILTSNVQRVDVVR